MSLKYRFVIEGDYTYEFETADRIWLCKSSRLITERGYVYLSGIGSDEGFNVYHFAISHPNGDKFSSMSVDNMHIEPIYDLRNGTKNAIALAGTFRKITPNSKSPSAVSINKLSGPPAGLIIPLPPEPKLEAKKSCNCSSKQVFNFGCPSASGGSCPNLQLSGPGNFPVASYLPMQIKTEGALVKRVGTYGLKPFFDEDEGTNVKSWDEWVGEEESSFIKVMQKEIDEFMERMTQEMLDVGDYEIMFKDDKK